jgi:small subunit ribosomal protein S1
VLHVDENQKRLSLGLKQMQPDVWETFFSSHTVGETLPGCVTRSARFGFFVELVPGVEGLCHHSEIPAASGNKGKSPLKIGAASDFRIIKLDEFERKISLSRFDLENPLPHPPPPRAAAQSGA